MGSIYRHQRWLISTFLCPAAWRYLQFCINKCLPFHVSTIPTGKFSTGVHQTSEAGCASVTSARGLSTCLSGRLAHLGGFKRDGEFPTGHTSVAPSGMDPKLSKVGTHTYSGFEFIRMHSWTHKYTLERMSEHKGLISSYQLLITAACTNTGGKMKGSCPTAADRCLFVPRHS